MNKVTVIGLGAMGIALARRLADAGLEVTAWNRTAAKADLVNHQGVRLVSDALNAVRDSPVIVVCVTNYDASAAIFADERIAAAMKGKLLVQLSSGTPQDARDSEAWSNARGIAYLDGAIMATPVQIGSAQAAIFVSGQDAAWLKAQAILAPLAATVNHVGAAPGLAATIDLAILSYLFSALLGFYHGANVYRAEGLPIAAFGAIIGQLGPTLTQMVEHEARTIVDGSYDQAVSTVRIVAETAETLTRHARQAGINTEIPAFSAHIYNKAVAAGYGEQQVAALFKHLQAENS